MAAKQAPFEVADAQLAEARERYEHFMANPDEVRQVLAEGADRARTTGGRPWIAAIGRGLVSR